MMLSVLANQERRRRADWGSEGMTLVEITVVLLVMAIILPVITTFLISTQRDTSTVASRTHASGVAEVIDEQISRALDNVTYLTTANGEAAGGEVMAAAATSFEFYSYPLDPDGPALDDIKLVQACLGCAYDELVETSIAAGNNASSPTYTSTPTTQILGTGVIPPSTLAYCPTAGTEIPVFQYYDSSGNCLLNSANTTSSAGPPANLLLNPDKYASVYSVTVTLTVGDPLHLSASAEPTFTYSFSMPNVADQSYKD